MEKKVRCPYCKEPAEYKGNGRARYECKNPKCPVIQFHLKELRPNRILMDSVMARANDPPRMVS